MSIQPLDILERYWGFTEFKPLQEDIICSVLENNDTLALLPTGGGKSICYQIPALIKEGICIVISPLIALMDDQVNNLKSKGIKALAIKGGISYNDLDSLLDNCIYGNYKFLFLSPERLKQDLVRQRIQQMNVNLIAVDEAHCISQWGHDFRPAYKSINLIRDLIPSVNILALTATAKPEVVDEIVSELDFISPKVFKSSFQRQNLSYKVIITEDKNYELLHSLKNGLPAIIYVRSRGNAESIHRLLKDKGISSDYFHGGIENSKKNEKLNDFLSDKTLVMVATTAFGMGIDKANVRTIIHINLPESIESYYQESGRAGRDGKDSNAVMIVGKNDEQRLKDQFLNTLADTNTIKNVYNKLSNYLYVPFGEGYLQSYNLNFNDFCKTYGFNSNQVYNIFKILDRNSIIQLDPRFSHQTRLRFIVDHASLMTYIEKNSGFETVIKSILRTYGGIMDNLLKINLDVISKKADLKIEQILHILMTLKKEELAEFEYHKTDTTITYLEPREDDNTINRISKEIKLHNRSKKDQVNAVIDYVKNEEECRNIQLLRYFGEDNDKPCGKCSVCVDKMSKTQEINYKAIRNAIILQLEEQPATSRSLVDALKSRDNEQHILEVLKQLLEQDIIEITNTNTYKIKYT